MNLNEFDSKSCKQVRSYLDSYLNGELLVETNHNLQKHLNGCQSCTEELETRERVKALLHRAVTQVTAPASLREKIQIDIRSNHPVVVFPQILLLRGRMAFAACALVVLCLGAWGTSRWWNSSTGFGEDGQMELARDFPDHLRQILDIGLSDHIHCAINDNVRKSFFNAGDMPSALKPEYVEMLAEINSQAGGNYELTAHHCIVNGREFTHLILKRGETVMSLAMTEKKGEAFDDLARASSTDTQGSGLHRARLRKFEVVGFETATHLAFVVSNLPAEENLRIATAVTPAVREYLSKLEAVA